MLTPSSSQNEEPVALGFNAEVTNSKPLIDTLAGIHNGKPDQHTLCGVDEDGITFKVHDLGNNIQGLATLASSLFHVFVLDEGLNEMEFKINVAAMLKCLNIYGPNSGGQTCSTMEYDQESPDFRLQLRMNSGSSSNISTQCRIKTLAESEQSFNTNINLFSALRDSKTVGQAIIFSDALSDAFCEIYSLPGAATVSLMMSPVAPFFQLSAEGTTGKCMIEFPKGSESFKTFQCEHTVRYHYQLSLIQDALKVLPSAHQTNIQMAENGLLCFQHRLQHKSGEVSYVEFVILPDDDGEESDDENDQQLQGTSQESSTSSHKKRRRNEVGQEANTASELFDDEEDDQHDLEQHRDDRADSEDPYNQGKFMEEDDGGDGSGGGDGGSGGSDDVDDDDARGSGRRRRSSSRRRSRENLEENNNNMEEEDSDDSVIGPSDNEMSDDSDGETQPEL